MMSIVEEALRYGINWFDTPEINSEEALAVALDEIGVGPDDVAIAPSGGLFCDRPSPAPGDSRMPRHRELIRPAWLQCGDPQ